jgi:hypothetical protein
MSLEKWAEFDWLRKEASSRQEIKGLVSIVDRDLSDAEVEVISDDRRFEAAFAAARTLASIALRASGYRATGQAHHQHTIESLEFTITADAKLIQRLRTLSKKRNATSYDHAGNVSAQDVSLAIQTASELQKLVLPWLERNHPRLAKD